MVFLICKQIEGAVMRSKNVANEQKTETLALGLGREKRSEEILRYSWRDAMTIVGDGERSRRGDLKGDKSLCRIPASYSEESLHSVFLYQAPGPGSRSSAYSRHSYFASLHFQSDYSPRRSSHSLYDPISHPENRNSDFLLISPIILYKN